MGQRSTIAVATALVCCHTVFLQSARAQDYWGRSLNAQPKNYIFGYGSLINDDSREKTSGKRTAVIPVRVSRDFGYVRAWNFRSPSGFTALGLKKASPSSSSTINGVVYPVEGTDMKPFDDRERGYTREEIPRHQIQAVSFLKLPDEGKIWVYIPNGPQHVGVGLPPPDVQFPILQSYVDVCVSGALRYGDEFAAEFLETTFDWNGLWLNDRTLARRPWVFEKNQGTVDRLLQQHPADRGRRTFASRRFPSQFAALLVSQSADSRARGIRFVNSLQNTDGGYAAEQPSSRSLLSATTKSLRALHYFGGQSSRHNLAEQFVLSCYDDSTGGFAELPGMQPDVESTAMGLMAMVELQMDPATYEKPINEFFRRRCKDIRDIYIASAALHAADLPKPLAKEWIMAYQKTRNPDGTYGKEVTDSASAVITILRLGGQIDAVSKDAVIGSLLTAQQESGGFAAGGNKPSLSTSYPVMRALYMLGAAPDVDRCRSFVARCQNLDGGFGGTPEQTSKAATSYFAAVVTYWLDKMK